MNKNKLQLSEAYNSQITTINENTIKNIVRETLHQLLENM